MRFIAALVIVLGLMVSTSQARCTSGKCGIDRVGAVATRVVKAPRRIVGKVVDAQPVRSLVAKRPVRKLVKQRPVRKLLARRPIRRALCCR